MRHKGMAVAIVLAASVAGRAGEDEGQPDPWAAFKAQSAALQGPEGLTLKLETDKKEYYGGEPILVTMTYEMNGSGQVRVWNGTGDRSGRIRDLDWTCVGPDRKLAPDPLQGYWFGGIGGGFGNYTTVSDKKPFSQSFYVNEWVRFDKEGEYRIAVVSSRLDGAGSVASNRVKVTVRKPTEAEIDAAIVKYTKAMDERKPKRDFKGGFDYYQAALFLRFLHQDKAVPYYLKYLKCLDERRLSFQSECGLYGLPDRKMAFEVLSSRITHRDYPISETTRWLYERLYRALNPPPKNQEPDWPGGLTQDQRKEIKTRLRGLAAAKSPRARAVSVYALTPPNEGDPAYAMNLAKSLQDMPEELLSAAVFRLGLKKVPAIVPYLEGYLTHEDRDVRTNALEGLIRQGNEKYLEMYLGDYVAQQPYYGSLYDHPKELSKQRQLELAALLDNPDSTVAQRAADRLKKFATSRELVPFLRKGLRRWTYVWGARPRILEAWTKVDPEGAKQTLLEYMRSDPRSNRPHNIVGSLRHYLEDPNVVQLVLEVARSDRAPWRAQKLLVDNRHPEVLPILLDQARAAPNALSLSFWRHGLEKVTGHIVPLTAMHNTPAKQAAVLDEWERWWHAYKEKRQIERDRANIEHAIGLLDVRTNGLWYRADQILTEITGKRFELDLYLDANVRNLQKLKALWTKWWEDNRETFRRAIRR